MLGGVVSYSIIEHKHRFAVWAAARATSRGAARQGISLDVELSQELICNVGLRDYIADPGWLPRVEDIDAAHLEWRDKMIVESGRDGKSLTHGLAAKLINIYLKSVFLCGGFHQHSKVAALHPPIDRLLLDKLARKNVGGHRHFWRAMHGRGWTRFDSDEYLSVISKIRNVMGGRPLWEIERYWPVAQSLRGPDAGHDASL